MESQCRTWLTTPSGDDATLWQKSSATDLYWRILTKRKDFESDTDRLDWLIDWSGWEWRWFWIGHWPPWLIDIWEWRWFWIRHWPPSRRPCPAASPTGGWRGRRGQARRPGHCDCDDWDWDVDNYNFDDCDWMLHIIIIVMIVIVMIVIERPREASC